MIEGYEFAPSSRRLLQTIFPSYKDKRPNLAVVFVTILHGCILISHASATPNPNLQLPKPHKITSRRTLPLRGRSIRIHSYTIRLHHKAKYLYDSQLLQSKILPTHALAQIQGQRELHFPIWLSPETPWSLLVTTIVSVDPVNGTTCSYNNRRSGWVFHSHAYS